MRIEEETGLLLVGYPFGWTLMLKCFSTKCGGVPKGSTQHRGDRRSKQVVAGGFTAVTFAPLALSAQYRKMQNFGVTPVNP